MKSINKKFRENIRKFQSAQIHTACEVRGQHLVSVRDRDGNFRTSMKTVRVQNRISQARYIPAPRKGLVQVPVEKDGARVHHQGPQAANR